MYCCSSRVGQLQVGAWAGEMCVRRWLNFRCCRVVGGCGCGLVGVGCGWLCRWVVGACDLEIRKHPAVAAAAAVLLLLHGDGISVRSPVHSSVDGPFHSFVIAAATPAPAARAYSAQLATTSVRLTVHSRPGRSRRRSRTTGRSFARPPIVCSLTRSSVVRSLVAVLDRLRRPPAVKVARSIVARSVDRAAARAPPPLYSTNLCSPHELLLLTAVVHLYCRCRTHLPGATHSQNAS